MYTIRGAKAEVKNAIRGYLFKDEQENYIYLILPVTFSTVG